MPTSPSTQVQVAQKGSAAVAVLLILMLIVALGAAQMADALVETRMAANDLSHRMAVNLGMAVMNLAIDALVSSALNNRQWNWNQLLKGPDGILENCSLSGDTRHEPVTMALALLWPANGRCNTCGDDGIVRDWVTGHMIIGPAGLIIEQTEEGELLLLLDSILLDCSSPAVWHATPLLAHAWAKLSDNDEPDGDPAVDTDSLAVLRITVAVARLPSDAAAIGRSIPRNSVARLESWLKRNPDGTLLTLSVREVVP